MRLQKSARHYPLMAAAAAALLLAFLADISCARDADFEMLVKKEGPPAARLLDNPTLYREARLDGLPCTVDDLDFLLDRPRTSLALAGKLHKSLDRYMVESRGAGSLHVDDSKRLVGDMELVSHTPGRRLYYVTGYWKLLAGVTLKGRMALVVDYAERHTASGTATDARARGYMLVDNVVVDKALKVLAHYFPRKVDARIERFATAVRKVVVAVKTDPEGALKKLEGTKYVPEQEVWEFRTRFVPAPH